MPGARTPDPGGSRNRHGGDLFGRFDVTAVARQTAATWLDHWPALKHGDAMSNLSALRGDRTKPRDIVPSGDPNAPDSDF